MADSFDDLLNLSNDSIELAIASTARITASSEAFGEALGTRAQELAYANYLEGEAQSRMLIGVAGKIAADFDQLRETFQAETELFTAHFATSIDAFLRARALQQTPEEEEIIRDGLRDLEGLPEALYALERQLITIQNMTAGLISIAQVQADAQVRAAAVIERLKREIRSAAEMIEAVCAPK
ncbi:MAG: hypothetical protein ABI876_16775 [Bacteroidota bacterium]